MFNYIFVRTNLFTKVYETTKIENNLIHGLIDINNDDKTFCGVDSPWKSFPPTVTIAWNSPPEVYLKLCQTVKIESFKSFKT